MTGLSSKDVIRFVRFGSFEKNAGYSGKGFPIDEDVLFAFLRVSQFYKTFVLEQFVDDGAIQSNCAYLFRLNCHSSPALPFAYKFSRTC